MNMREGYIINEISTYIDVLALIVLLGGVFTCARHINEEVTLLKAGRICLTLFQILETDCTWRIPLSQANLKVDSEPAVKDLEFDRHLLLKLSVKVFPLCFDNFIEVM